MAKRVAIVLALVGVVLGVLWLRRSRPASTSSTDASVAEAPALGEAPAGSDERAPRSSLAGRVTDPAGAPLAAADVCARALSRRLGSAFTTVPRCVATGADGGYRFEDLPPSSYEMGAGKRGYSPAVVRTIVLGAGQAREGVDFALVRGGVAVRGRVHDIAGGAVARAFLALSPANVVVRSDDDGRFEAWVEPGSVRVLATADGYAPFLAHGFAPGPTLDLVMTPESTIEGRVVEAGTNAPVANIAVWVGPVEAISLASDTVTAVTDADGHFVFRGLEPGRYKPQAAAGARRGAARTSVLLGLADRITDVVVEIAAAAYVRGRVVGPGGEGCSGAVVRLLDRNASTFREARSEDSGDFLVDALPPGTYEASVECPGTPTQPIERPLSVATEPVTGLVWTVGRGHVVRGTVVDAKGAPVPDATIEAEPSKGRSARTTSAADGSFELRAIPTGPCKLVPHREGLAPPEPEVVVTIDRDREGIRLVFRSGGTLEGTVLDEGGQSPADVLVDAHVPGGFQASGAVSDDGTFRIPGLPPGEYEVTLRSGARSVLAPGETEQRVTRAIIRDDATTTLKLVVEGARGTIRGRVVDGAGAPIDDALVDAERESETALQWMRSDFVGRKPVLVDRDGNFAIGKLPPGSYIVRATRRGGGEAIAKSVALGASVVLAIRADATIDGKVTGEVPRSFRVHVRDEASGYGRGEIFTSPDGWFSMHDLPAGAYVVTVEGAGRKGSGNVTVRDGERRDVEVDLRPR